MIEQEIWRQMRQLGGYAAAQRYVGDHGADTSEPTAAVRERHNQLLAQRHRGVEHFPERRDVGTEQRYAGVDRLDRAETESLKARRKHHRVDGRVKQPD